jgi:hypothetical protein
MKTFSLCISFGSDSQVRTRYFSFSSRPDSAELADALEAFFSPDGLNPTTKSAVPRMPCALLRKPHGKTDSDHRR